MPEKAYMKARTLFDKSNRFKIKLYFYLQYDFHTLKADSVSYKYYIIPEIFRSKLRFSL